MMSAPAVDSSTPHAAAKRGVPPGFLRDVLVSGVLPWVAVVVLQRAGVPLVTALALSTVFPVIDGLVAFARRRRVDAIAIVNLAFIAGSIAVSLVSGDVHVLLLKGAILTGAFSVVCLGSLLAPRPIVFYLGRQFTCGDDAALVAQWNARWNRPRFRSTLRLMTAVWGLGYALEVIVRVVAAYTLAPATVVLTAPLITYGVLALLIAWTVSYGNAMNRKDAARP